MNTESRITDALMALQGEGVPMIELGAIEAKLITLLNRARRLNRAASMLPLIGAEETAAALNCHRATVYRLVGKKSKKVA